MGQFLWIFSQYCLRHWLESLSSSPSFHVLCVVDFSILLIFSNTVEYQWACNVLHIAIGTFPVIPKYYSNLFILSTATDVFTQLMPVAGVHLCISPPLSLVFIIIFKSVGYDFKIIFEIFCMRHRMLWFNRNQSLSQVCLVPLVLL